MTTTTKKTKKEIIQEAAAHLFRDKGYSATSMRDLAEAVNLKASSLYNHISSKEEILRNICFDNAHRFISGMEEVEKSILRQALSESGGNKTKTAKGLGITREGLHKKISKYGIK